MRRTSLLLSDDVQYGLLDVEQLVLNPGHVMELVERTPLHFQHFIVAGSVVKEIGALREVFHHVQRTQVRDPVGIVPRNRQQIAHEVGVTTHFRHLAGSQKLESSF